MNVVIVAVLVAVITLAIMGSIPGSEEGPRSVESHPSATIQSWSANPSTITLGQAATFTVNQTANTCCDPYDYFTHDTLLGCTNTTMQTLGTSATRASWGCTPSSIGTFIINVQIRGSARSYTTPAWTNLTVTGSQGSNSTALGNTPSGGPPYWLYAGVGIIVAASLAVVLAVVRQRKKTDSSLPPGTPPSIRNRTRTANPCSGSATPTTDDGKKLPEVC